MENHFGFTLEKWMIHTDLKSVPFIDVEITKLLYNDDVKIVSWVAQDKSILMCSIIYHQE